MTTERLKRPGEIATAVVTINNDGEVPARYAVEVFPGTLQPLGAFNADVFAPLVFTDTVQPGAVTTVRAPLNLPPGISEGSKVLRVRIGQVGPTGQLVNVLDEQFVSGRLRVERPQIEMIPLPGEPEIPTPEIPTVAMRPHRFPIGGRVNTNLPEGVFPGAVTRHEGHSATGEPRYGLTLDPLPETGFSGANATGIPESLLTPEIPTVAMRPHRFPIGSRVDTNLPEGVFPGAVTRHEGHSAAGEPLYGLTLDPIQETGFPGANATSIPERFLTPGGPPRPLGLEPLEPLPDTPSPGGLPLVQEGLFPGDLDLLEQAVVASPATVEIGDTITIIIPFQPPSSVSLLGDVFVLGPPPEGNTVASFQGISFTPDRGVTLRWTVPQRDSARRPITAGSYGLRVFVRDPRTFVPGDPSTFLIRDDVEDVFQVILPAPAEPTIFAPPPPELEAPELLPEIQPEVLPPPPAPTTAVPTPGPVPTPPPQPEGIFPGELVLGPTSGGLGRPGADPDTASPGDIIDLTLALANQSDSSAVLRILAFPRDSNGRTRGTLESSVPIGPFGRQLTRLSYRVPEDAGPGDWGLRLFIWDPNTFVPGDPSTYLVQETFEGVFGVR